MSQRRDKSQHTEVRRRQQLQQQTTSTGISYYLSSNLLESIQMYDDENTTRASGCHRSRLVDVPGNIGGRHQQQSQHQDLAPIELTKNVISTRVSSILDNLNSQLNYSRFQSYKTRSVPASNVAPLWVLSCCCLVLMLAINPGLGAPTTGIVSHLPVSLSSVNIHDNNGPSNLHSQVVIHKHATANIQQQNLMTSGSVDVSPIIIVNPNDDDESIKQRDLSSGSVTSAGYGVDKSVAADDESSIEDETILVVLAGEPSSSSIRRLIKRSGISDQRLAEIQMIRALKKQMERAATKIAAESGGNGGGEIGVSSGNAGSSEVK